MSSKKEIRIPVRSLALDLSKKKDLESYQEKLKQEHPNIKVLANCAGFGKINHYENEDTQTYLNMIDLNNKAVVAMIGYSLPYMAYHAKIMNLVSDSAFQPLPYLNVYAATKAFLLSYSRSLNVELKYRGIHVLAVCPFWVHTEFFDRALNETDKQIIYRYGTIYKKQDVIERAIKDLYSNRDVSVYGIRNKLQRIGAKCFPHALTMKVWMKYQKFDGTPNTRK